MGVSTRYSYGTPIRIYRVSTVYLPYINRISTVVDSGRAAEKIGTIHYLLGSGEG